MNKLTLAWNASVLILSIGDWSIRGKHEKFSGGNSGSAARCV